MKTISLFLFILIFTGFISSCGLLSSDDKVDSIYLRITNLSSLEFNSVYVSFPGDEATFSSVAPGKTSDYKKMNNAYRYGFIKVESGDDEYVLQPIDYVGEESLKNGRYTYQLNIVGDSLTLNFIED